MPYIVQYFLTGFARVQIELEFVHIIMKFCRLAGKHIESVFFFFFEDSNCCVNGKVNYD
jgi:hypothetical protein